MPRYIMLVLANSATEGGSTAEELVQMGEFNKSLRDAGLLLAAEGLAPTSEGYRITFRGTTVLEKGPFDLETQGTISGYWFLKADNIETVLEYAKKVPFREGKVEVRRVAGSDDFGEKLLGEIQELQTQMKAAFQRKY